MNRTITQPRSKQNTISTSLFLVTLLMLSACSSAPEDEANAENGQKNTTAQVSAPQNPTDVVPDDQNPELALAIAAGAVIVSGDTPAAAVAQNQATPPTPGDSSAAVPPAPDSTSPQASAPPPPMSSDPFVTEPTTQASKKSRHAKKGKKHSGRAVASVPKGDSQGYQVKKGDTLMKIAFEQYGNLYRWKDIYAANKGSIQDPNHVPPGTILQLEAPGSGRRPSSVALEHNGDQYLIKIGDTLGTISNDVYGTAMKWKALWENNRQLIKDPNKIYAGFFLYYVPAQQHASN